MYDHTRMSDAMLQNPPAELTAAVTGVPPGRWGVGVSGGADSVALLLLLNDRRAADIHVIHLDHETRDGESGDDAAFVAELAARLNLRSTIRCRSEMETGQSGLASNVSARFRAARFELFRRVAASESLDGVILAHHADDQAETVLLRILRGSGPTAISGMRPRAMVEGLTVLRPLLEVSPQLLRDFLRKRNETWREDSSNHSEKYLRNQLRRWLADLPELRTGLLKLGSQSDTLRDWLDAQSPQLANPFAATELACLPAPLARQAAARWLAARGSPPRELSRHICDQLVVMTADAASPARRHFPGKVLVQRRCGLICGS
jgi:tRNA(Ile)-lysidine synthase